MIFFWGVEAAAGDSNFSASIASSSSRKNKVVVVAVANKVVVVVVLGVLACLALFVGTKMQPEDDGVVNAATGTPLAAMPMDRIPKLNLIIIVK